MDRKTVVLVPGLICNWRLWRHQIDHLGKDCEVIIGDTLNDDSIRGMVNRILSQAPERFSLAGLSMGGYVSMELMRVAPERVERLALIDTTARLDKPEQRERRKALISMSKMGKFKGVTPRLLPLFLHPDRLEDEKICNEIMEMAQEVGQKTFIHQQTAILAREEVISILPGIKVPTTVICGAQDALTPPEHSREMASLIPGAQLHLIDDCGHLAPLEQPDTTTTLLREWLEIDR